MLPHLTNHCKCIVGGSGLLETVRASYLHVRSSSSGTIQSNHALGDLAGRSWLPIGDQGGIGFPVTVVRQPAVQNCNVIYDRRTEDHVFGHKSVATVFEVKELFSAGLMQ